jgi:hypothetical protein
MTVTDLQKLVEQKVAEATGAHGGGKMKIQEHLKGLAESAKTIHKCNKALTAALADHVERLSALVKAGPGKWDLAGWTLDSEGRPVNGPADKVVKGFFDELYGRPDVTLTPPARYDGLFE